MSTRNLGQDNRFITGPALFQHHLPIIFNPDIQVRARTQLFGRNRPGDRKPGDRYRLGGAILGLIVGGIAGAVILSRFLDIGGVVIGFFVGAIIGVVIGNRLGYAIWKWRTGGTSPPAPPGDSPLAT